MKFKTLYYFILNIAVVALWINHYIISYLF